jgi:putative endonuclease
MCMLRGGCVYIMTNKSHSVLYTGVTSDLIQRVQQHMSSHYPNSFTSKYNVYKLVYYHSFNTIEEAIGEEKRIKGGSRKKKVALIESINPGWEDLWEKEVSKW